VDHTEGVGLARGWAVLAVTAVVGLGFGAAPALGVLVPAVAVLAALSSLPEAGARLKRGRGPKESWLVPLAAGIAAGAIPALAWIITGGPGWLACLTAFAGSALWVGGSVSGRWEAAAAGLPVMAFLGYASGAGLVYYIGPAAAWAVLGVWAAVRTDARPGLARRAERLETAIYLLAAGVMTVARLADLMWRV